MFDTFRTIPEIAETFFLQIKDVFLNYSVVSDTLDIIAFTVIIYLLLKQVRKTQSFQVVKGLIALGFVYILVVLFGMTASKFVLSKLFSDIILVFVILFSKEIRQLLERIGNGRKGRKTTGDSEVLTQIVRAVGSMGRNKVGSLMLIERDTMLGDLQKNSVHLDCDISIESISSIFWPKAPLHDGAVIIRDDKIVAARCVVPMNNSVHLESDADHPVGTRHRAAVEASAASDCIAVVTSEETGIISYAVNGHLYRNLTDSQLYEKLSELLADKKSAKKLKKSASKADKNEIAAEQTEETINSAEPETEMNDISAEEENTVAVSEETKGEEENNG